MATPQLSKLNRLHVDLTDTFAALLRGEPLLDAFGTAVLDEKGRPIFIPPKANILKEIREFLKDNGIDREPIEASGLPEMAKQIRQWDDEPLLLEVEENQ